MLQNLPAELLNHIAEALSTRKDINALIRTCRHAYTSINKYFYTRYARYIFIKSAHQGWADTLRRAVHYGLDVNVAENLGSVTPFLLAVRFRRFECVKILLDLNLNITDREKDQIRRAVEWATGRNDVKILQLLLAYPRLPDTVVSEALWRAVCGRWNTQRDVLQLLLQHEGIDVNVTFDNGQTALAIATHQGNVKAQDLLIADERVDMSCLVLVTGDPVSLTILRDGNEDIANRLFMNHRHRIDFERETSTGNNVLHISAKRLRPQHCEILLRECPGLLYRRNIHGNTPFFSIIKALSGTKHGKAITEKMKPARSQICSMFLEQPQVNYYARNEWGSTLLLEAAKYGDLDLFTSLLVKAHPEQVHDADANGDTPVLLAASNGQTDILQYLLDNGADANHQNKQSHTPLMLAMQNKKTASVRILLSQDS